MTNWERETTRIIKAVSKVKANNQEEKLIKMSVLMYLYKSLESEQTFNTNCEVLNKVKVKRK